MSLPATESRSTGTQSPSPDIAAVKLPGFWIIGAELWFVTIEFVYRKKKTPNNEILKYDYAVVVLPQSTASIVGDILRAPPADNPHDKLRTELTRRTTESEKRRTQQLLTTEKLGDRKPFELLRRMHQLLGDHDETIDGSIFRELFLQRLPHQARMILSILAEPLETLAQTADKIMNVSTLGISAFHKKAPAAAQPQASASLEEKASQLLQLKNRLSEQVVQLAKSLRDLHSRPSRSPSPQTSRSRWRCTSRTATNNCWYHQ